MWALLVQASNTIYPPLLCSVHVPAAFRRYTAYAIYGMRVARGLRRALHKQCSSGRLVYVRGSTERMMLCNAQHAEEENNPLPSDARMVNRSMSGTSLALMQAGSAIREELERQHNMPIYAGESAFSGETYRIAHSVAWCLPA